jgi:hypothetical protein
VKGRLVGQRASAVGRTRLLAFDDRLELLSDGGAHRVELRRLFFDELTGATVHAAVQWTTVLVGGVLGLGALVSGLALVPYVAPLGGGLALLGLAGLAAAVLAVVQPRHVLKVHAPGQVFVTLLPRGDERRERVLQELRAAVDVYQNRGLRVAAPAPPAPATPEPAPSEPA